MDLLKIIRTIPDYPKPGILFYDISPLLAHAEAWRFCINALGKAVRAASPDILVGIESRGFLLTAPLAYEIGVGFAMIRKSNKLPGKVASFEYELEYGKDTIEIQSDAIQKNDRVVVLDDLLATGGTMDAAIKLIRQVGGNPVLGACILELQGLGGRARVNLDIVSQIQCEA
ncbi:MAG: adenine phosphoribosyltransferase [Pseudomonadota bacterium]